VESTKSGSALLDLPAGVFSYLKTIYTSSSFCAKQTNTDTKSKKMFCCLRTWLA